MAAWLGWDGDYVVTRFLLQRGLAFCYAVAFLIVVNQFCALSGEKGLQPIHHSFGSSFWTNPSLFYFFRTDTVLTLAGYLGLGLSLFALSGYSDKLGVAVSVTTWGMLWALYLSFVNAGGTFYGFGWELLLCEAGFLAIFLGPQNVAPPVLVIWLFRWLLFRLMFGAGMIKWRSDEAWRDFSCMNYHYETQPLPNAVSWFLHHAPKGVHRFETAMTLFLEIAIPFGFFGPGRVAWVAGALTIFLQGLIILSGNLSWLNFLTIALCIPCFDDRAFAFLTGLVTRAELVTVPVQQYLVYVLTGLTLLLSYKPAKNLLSKDQVMIASYNPFHYVNTYGLFGGITRERPEVIIQGTSSEVLTPTTEWREYEFKAKPGNPAKRPAFVSPYHYKLDWQMWFAAMGSYYENPWLLNLVGKLLENDRSALSLMGDNPFPNSPPRYIRLELYEYRFTKPRDAGGNWWTRVRVDSYIEPLSLENPGFQDALRQIREP